jgi:tetratricopeptide (TPR) repeat protein
MLQRQRTAGLRAGQVADAALSAFCQAKQKKFAAAYTACDQALRLSEELPDTTCLIVSLQTLGVIQVWDGEAATALQALDRAQKLARDRGDLLRQYTCHGYRGYALVNAGRSGEGIEAFSEALAMAAELRLQFMTAMFSAWLAEALIDTGEYDQALGVARNAVRLANERNEAWARSVALRVVGQALSLSPADDGGKLVDRILRCAQEMQSSLGLTLETDRTAETRAEVARALN